MTELILLCLTGCISSFAFSAYIDRVDVAEGSILAIVVHSRLAARRSLSRKR